MQQGTKCFFFQKEKQIFSYNFQYYSLHITAFSTAFNGGGKKIVISDQEITQMEFDSLKGPLMYSGVEDKNGHMWLT